MSKVSDISQDELEIYEEDFALLDDNKNGVLVLSTITRASHC